MSGGQTQTITEQQRERLIVKPAGAAHRLLYKPVRLDENIGESFILLRGKEEVNNLILN